MSILAAELIWRHPQERSDFGSNGGRMTATPIPSAVKNNIWPDVPQSERTVGSLKYRKAHIHVANDDDLTLVRARAFIETYTPGDDTVTIFPGTHTDTQSAITGTEQLYGCGQLNVDVLAAAATMDVMTEDATLDFFKDGMLVRISDKTDVDDATGNEEYVTIVGAPTYVGDVATIAFTPALVNGYAAASTRVASVIESGDTAASYAAFVVTSTAGTFDDTTHPVLLDHIASVEQSWTLTFTSATEFTIVGDTLGSLGSGNTSSNVQPNNPDYSKPYFIMNAAGFGGTYVAGDTITFTTSPAGIPVWYRRAIPVGANSLTGDKVIVGIDGESG